MANPNLSSDKESLSSADVAFENSIRPSQINDFSGQDQIIENLRIFIKAAKIRGRGAGPCFISWSLRVWVKQPYQELLPMNWE